MESISFTYKEAEQIDNMGIDGGTVHLINPTKVRDENINVTGYFAQIAKFDPKQHKRVSTGITVFSGVNESGESDGVYKT
jgi:hypothetical protein